MTKRYDHKLCAGEIQVHAYEIHNFKSFYDRFLFFVHGYMTQLPRNKVTLLQNVLNLLFNMFFNCAMSISYLVQTAQVSSF